ncbi:MULTISPECIES: hypothetical protein [unclassified Pseudomonas]|uniref:hypothetical protein n=1 Tax=unclassified Pseudomonas TaxID=196821 RepID=UPI00385C307D
MKGKYRWSIAGLLFFAGMLNYLDRAALSVVAPLLKTELHIDDAQMGFIFSSFLLVTVRCALLADGRRINMAPKRCLPGQREVGRCSAV